MADVILASDPEHLAEDCDALVLVTDWLQFRQLDYAQVAQRMITPILIDGRNCLDPVQLQQSGFYYIGIGRSQARYVLPFVSILTSNRHFAVSSSERESVIATS